MASVGLFVELPKVGLKPSELAVVYIKGDKKSEDKKLSKKNPDTLDL